MIRTLSKLKVSITIFSLAVLVLASSSFQTASALADAEFSVVVNSARDGVAEISIVDGGGSLAQVGGDWKVLVSTVSPHFQRGCWGPEPKCTVTGLVDGTQYSLSASNLYAGIYVKGKPLVTYKSYESLGKIQVLRDGLFSLRASTGIWNPLPFFNYAWFKNGQLLPEETQETLYLKQSDFGNNFQVQVRSFKDPYEKQTILSPAFNVAAPNVPCIADPDLSLWLKTKGQPTISGKPIIGEKLKASTGVWSKDSKLCSFWYSDGKSLGKSVSLSYTPLSSDAGKSLQYIVIGTQKDGSKAVRFSDPVVILKKTFTAAKSPTLSGSLTLGSKLTGAYQQWESGTTVTTSWLRGNSPISSASKNTYTLTERDLGNIILFQICGSKKDYETKCLHTSRTIPLGNIKPVPKVSWVANTSQVGGTITINEGSWPTGVTVTFGWLRNSIAIEALATDTYTITAEDRGSTLAATLTASKPGYSTVIVSIPIGIIP